MSFPGSVHQFHSEPLENLLMPGTPAHFDPFLPCCSQRCLVKNDSEIDLWPC